MKKSIRIFASALMLTAFVSATTLVSAQDGAPKDQQEMMQKQKQEIEPETLPEKVTTSIDKSDYAEWKIDKAYVVSKTNQKVYEVHFKNPQGKIEKQSYDKNGKVIGA